MKSIRRKIKPKVDHRVTSFLRIMKLELVNSNAFQIGAPRTTDIIRGTGVLREEEYKLFKKEVAQLRNNIRKVKNATTDDEILQHAIAICQDKRLHWNRAFDRHTVDYIKRGRPVKAVRLQQFQIDAGIAYQSLIEK